jgi:predicted amidohydrolase
MQLRIALAQMEIQPGQPAANLARADSWASEAAKLGSDLLLLPELWSSGYDLERARALASKPNSGAHAAMADLARRHRLFVYGSILVEREPGKIGNTGLLFDPEGKAIAEYAKVHLFRLMNEDRHMQPGDRPVLVETPWGKTGLAVCYDLRFPELFRAYAVQGARAVLLVAEWPLPRLMHWQTLLRARAIENQLYMIACNCVGSSNGVQFFGHSTIVDPWGDIIVEADDRETLVTAAIDMARVEEVRRKLDVLSDRRPEAYRTAD